MSLIDDFYLTSDRHDASDFVPLIGYAQPNSRAVADPFQRTAGSSRSQDKNLGDHRRSRAQ
jgi:hypothetical protein